MNGSYFLRVGSCFSAAALRPSPLVIPIATFVGLLKVWHVLCSASVAYMARGDSSIRGGEPVNVSSSLQVAISCRAAVMPPGLHAPPFFTTMWPLGVQWAISQLLVTG